jgi:hypothetical protein
MMADRLAHPQFECDLDTEYGWPRIRFNFANGWSASVVVRTYANGMDALRASLAACPTKQWGKGKTELGEQEASADEVADWLHQVSQRPRP